MPEIPDGPIAWLNGQFLPAAQAALPVTDLGLHGIAVSEMVRTYDHILFRLPQHLQRLQESVRLAGLNQPEWPLEDICQQVARQNTSRLGSAHDLGLIVLVTAGTNPTYTGGGSEPTVAVHTFDLPLQRWSHSAQDGIHLLISGIRQLPEECCPSAIKSRSRLHWHLATQDVRGRDAQAWPVLLCDRGSVTETPSANVFAVYGESVVTPHHNVLPGITRDVVRELCPGLGLTCEEREIRPEQLTTADELFVSSTPCGLLPVTKFEFRDVNDGRPGPVFFELCNAFSELVGIDILDQLLAAQ